MLARSTTKDLVSLPKSSLLHVGTLHISLFHIYLDYNLPFFPQQRHCLSAITKSTAPDQMSFLKS